MTARPERCGACGHDGQTLIEVVVQGYVGWVCVDPVGCHRRGEQAGTWRRYDPAEVSS